MAAMFAISFRDIGHRNIEAADRPDWPWVSKLAAPASASSRSRSGAHEGQGVIRDLLGSMPT